MRKISANYIFPISSKPLKNGIIVIDDENIIADIIENPTSKEFANVEFYNGIIVPGFVNSHCHLELSMQNTKFENGSGLVNFLKTASKIKSENQYNIENCIDADQQMFLNGIQAVGDISNTDISFDIKKKSKIYYHTFVEILGLENLKIAQYFKQSLEIFEKYFPIFGGKSITPHAPYTVLPKLMNRINDFEKKQQSIISIHNQETKSENQFFEQAQGDLYNFINSFKNDICNLLPTKKSSLKSFLSNFSKKLNILLIHNTFTTEDDIDFAENYSQNLFWCLCPSSNLIIENQLPDIELFYKKKAKLTIGTDSLMSNNSLDILKEIKIIQTKFSNIPFEEIIKWATINGAEALKISHKFGSLEKGKAPGVILINNFDFENFKLSENSFIKRLI